MRRGVAPLGDVGDGEQRRPRSDEQLAVAHERLAVDLDRRLEHTQSRWTGTWTVPPIAAEAPKATCAVPRIFSSSRMLPVRIASSLVPIPSSATLVPSAPWAVSSSSSASPSAPTASVRCPSSDRQRDRLLDPADAGDRAVDDERALARALERRDEALAAGQVAEGAAGAELAGVGDRGAALEPEPQVAAVGAGDPRLGAAVEQLGRSPRPRRRSSSMSALITRASISSVTPGQRGDPDAGLAGRLAGGGVGERLDGRREHDVGGEHRRGHRPPAARPRASRARRSAPASPRRPRPGRRSASAPRAPR